jgi:hypothetical protein
MSFLQSEEWAADKQEWTSTHIITLQQKSVFEHVLWAEEILVRWQTVFFQVAEIRSPIPYVILQCDFDNPPRDVTNGPFKQEVLYDCHDQ